MTTWRQVKKEFNIYLPTTQFHFRICSVKQRAQSIRNSMRQIRKKEIITNFFQYSSSIFYLYLSRVFCLPTILTSTATIRCLIKCLLFFKFLVFFFTESHFQSLSNYNLFALLDIFTSSCTCFEKKFSFILSIRLNKFNVLFSHFVFAFLFSLH